MAFRRFKELRVFFWGADYSLAWIISILSSKMEVS